MLNFRYAISRQNKQNLNATELAKKGKVSRVWMSDLQRKEGCKVNVGLLTLIDFCNEVGFDVEQLIHDARDAMEE